MNIFSKGLSLLIAILVSASSCKQQKSTSSQEQTIQLNVSTEPPSLDPRLAIDTSSSFIIRSIFEGLMRQNPEGKIEPAMASEVTLSPDKKTYTFKLREAFWTNGDPVTAEDFAYAWKWILNPKNPSEIAYKLYVIKNGKAVKEGKLSAAELGLQVLDSKTLVVELEYPNPYFLEIVTLSAFYPINRHVDLKNPQWPDKASEDFVSNGPFNLKTWDHHNRIVLKKNPSYWDNEAVKLDIVNLNMVEDQNTELSMFEEGELDWAGSPFSLGLPSDAIPSLRKLGKLTINPLEIVYIYIFNTKKIPFNNVKVRKAFAYAIDREAIVSHLLQAEQIPAQGLIPPQMALQKTPYFSDHATTQAQELFKEGLKELGLTVFELPKITISYNTSEGHHKIAQAIQQQWSDTFHIPIYLENLEWKVYLDKVLSRDFVIARMGWTADYSDPLTFLELFKDANGPQNNTNWENQVYRDLLDQASQTQDKNKRDAFLQRAEQVLMEEMPISPIYFYTGSYLKNPHLENVYISPSSAADLKWAYFKNETNTTKR